MRVNGWSTLPARGWTSILVTANAISFSDEITMYDRNQSSNPPILVFINPVFIIIHMHG